MLRRVDMVGPDSDNFYIDGYHRGLAKMSPVRIMFLRRLVLPLSLYLQLTSRSECGVLIPSVPD